MPTKDVLVSQKFNNFNYAPGIATYGIDGKTGQTGLDGNNIYFTNCNIISDNDESDIKLLADLIRKNVLPVKGSTEKINRKYKNNDLFFDINGIIFKLIDIDALLGASEVGSYVNYFSIAGKITVENAKVFASSIENINNRLIFNSSDYSGYDIIKGIAPKDGAEYIDTDAAVNIISNVVNDNDNIEMVKMQSIDDVDIEDGKLSVYYKTTENAYYLESNKPIVINSDVKLNTENNTNNEYDNFSTVLTSNDTITYFKHICDKLRYNILYDSDVNRYKLVIYSTEESEEDQIKTLDYLVNRSKTVYGKVYDGKNDQMLMKLNNRIKDKTQALNYYEYGTNVELKTSEQFKSPIISDYKFDYVRVSDDDSRQTVSYTIKNTSVSVDINDDNTYLNNVNINVSLNNVFVITHDADASNLGNYIIDNKLIGLTLYYDYDEEHAYDSIAVSSTGITSDYARSIILNQNISNYVLPQIGKFNFIPKNIKDFIIEFKIIYYLDIPDGVKYQQYVNGPIIIKCNIEDLNLQIDNQYTLYFTLDYSEEKFSIKNIMISDKDDLDEYHDTNEKPCIETYLPNSVESVQRFSLLHNTEVFINYQE